MDMGSSKIITKLSHSISIRRVSNSGDILTSITGNS